MATNKEKITASALKHLKAGSLDKAVKEFEKLLELEPNDERTLQKIGELYSRLGRAQEAKNAYSRVSEIYVRQGFYLKAIAVVKQMLQFEPNQVDLHKKLAEMYQQLGLLSETIAQYQLLISLYEKQNRPQDALEALRRITSIDADNLPNRIHLAESFIKLGMAKEGLETYEDALEHLKRAGRQEDYLRVLERLVHNAPEKVERNAELARLYYERSEPKKCLARLKAVLAQWPTDIDTLTLLSRVFVDLGENEKAATVLHEIARLHSESGHEKAANEIRRKILTLRPQDNAARQALMGASFGGLSKPEPAIRSFRESETEIAQFGQSNAPQPVAAPRSTPAFDTSADNDSGAVTTPDLAPNLTKMMTEATVFSKYGLFAQAKERIEQVLLLAPDKLDALLLAGTVYKALALNEQASEANLKAAAAQLEKGMTNEPRSLLESVLPLGHHSALAASFLSRLAAKEAPLALGAELRQAMAKLATSSESEAPLVSPTPLAEAPLFDEPFAAVLSSEPLEPFIETVEAIPQADILAEEPLELVPEAVPAPPAQPPVLKAAPLGAETLVPEALVEEEALIEEEPLVPELPVEPLPESVSEQPLQESRAVAAEAPEAIVEELPPDEGEDELLDLDGIEDDHRPLLMSADKESGTLDLLSKESGILSLPEAAAVPLPEEESIPPIDPSLFNELLTLSEKDEELKELEFEGEDWAEVAPEVAPTTPAETPLPLPVTPVASETPSAPVEEPQAAPEAPAPAPQPTTDDTQEEWLEPELLAEEDIAAAPLAALLTTDQQADLEEAEFFFAQGLYGECLPIYRRLLPAAATHPHLVQRLRECESQVSASAEPAPSVLPAPSEPPKAAQALPETAAPKAPTLDFSQLEAEAGREHRGGEIADGSVDLSAEIMASLSMLDDDDASARKPPKPSPAKAAVSALDAEEMDTETHFNLGIAYREMGLQNEAIGEFLMARKGRFTPYANALVGLCYIAKGTQAMALDYFLEMLSDDALTRSLLIAVRLELGEYAEKQGEAALAMTHFAAVLAIDPDSAVAQTRWADLKAKNVTPASDDVDSLLASIDPLQLPVGDGQGLKFKAPSRNINSRNVSYL